MAAWISPGTRRWRSLRWPRTITASLRLRRRKIVEALGGLAEPDEVGEELGAAAEQKAAHRERRGEGDRSDHDVYGPPAFLSSAVTAGTISVRSPITA